ncbi:hypothetical protein CRD36_07215 [Paremcibacter congregatus]|uniref:Uncharacterized protein n=1 Tax=Paremcibacter congregatus TaxID=2043170 RepID=A0A2G4YS77_9PROT|nr:hypothetical protein CRD36_07215 [Paremcibacter congregatus]
MFHECFLSPLYTYGNATQIFPYPPYDERNAIIHHFILTKLLQQTASRSIRDIEKQVAIFRLKKNL